jgi:hypothetical protein
MGDMFGLPIETGSFRVQSYKNFLANIGLLFIHNYLSNYKLSDVQSSAVYVKRRPTDKTRKINELGLNLETLKKKSLDLTTSQINLKTQIEKEEGGVEMQEQLKQQKAQAKAIEEQIEEGTSQINKLVGTSSVKKVVAKKGLFKGGVKPKVSASSSEEKVEEPVKSYYTETEIEKMLKEKLLIDIANRFPDGSDMYSVAEIIGALPSSLTKDTLTVAMLKSGKFTGEKVKKEEMDMLDEFAAELEDEFGVMTMSEEGAEADEEGYDKDDLEDYNLMDEAENEDLLEENYEREGEEGDFY